MTYVYAFIRIPHAKVTEAYFTLLSGKLALVLGRFGQKIEAVLGKKTRFVLGEKWGAVMRKCWHGFGGPFATAKKWGVWGRI